MILHTFPIFTFHSNIIQNQATFNPIKNFHKVFNLDNPIDKWPVFNTYGPKHMRPQISTISAQITIDNISTVNAVIAQNVNEQTMNEASHK